MRIKPIVIFLCSLAVFLITTASLSLAQLPPGMPDAPSQAPIDGGLGIATIAGASYGIKKLINRQKSSK
jgi:hypothetical protein